MSEHRYSKTAWQIASRYSAVLASETRDLAAAIDAALEAERSACLAAASTSDIYLGTEDSSTGAPPSHACLTCGGDGKVPTGYSNRPHDECPDCNGDGRGQSHDAALDTPPDERAEGFGAILKDEAKRLRARADEMDPPRSAASTVEPMVERCIHGLPLTIECMTCATDYGDDRAVYLKAAPTTLEPDAVREAFIAGATAVHNEWVAASEREEGPPRGEPDFTEAASDYAAARNDRDTGGPRS